MADARSASGSIFSSFSTNSGGSSLADAVVVVLLDEKTVVVAEEEAVDVVLDRRVVKEFCSSSSDRTSPAADDMDPVIVDDDCATLVVKFDVDDEAGQDVCVLLKVVEELCSNTKSGNNDLLEVEQHGPLEIGVDSQLGEVEVFDGEKVALDKGRMSKSSGRKKHQEFHFSGDTTAIDNPEAVDGDDNGFCCSVG